MFLMRTLRNSYRWPKNANCDLSNPTRKGGERSLPVTRTGEVKMGILETLKSFPAMGPESTGKERIMAENLTAEQADKYMEEKMLFTPRMFKVINQLAPQCGKTFADFYNSIWADGNLPRKIKELIFMAGGVAYMSPRCIIHVVPAVKAG